MVLAALETIAKSTSLQHEPAFQYGEMAQVVLREQQVRVPVGLEVRLEAAPLLVDLVLVAVDDRRVGMRSQLQRQNDELEAWRTNLERDLEAARLTQQSLIPQKPRSRAASRSGPTSMPTRTVAWFSERASAEVRVTVPCDLPSEFFGRQVLPFGWVTSTGLSSTQLASEYLSGCASASR